MKQQLGRALGVAVILSQSEILDDIEEQLERVADELEAIEEIISAREYEDARANK